MAKIQNPRRVMRSIRWSNLLRPEEAAAVVQAWREGTGAEDRAVILAGGTAVVMERAIRRRRKVPRFYK